MANTLLTPTAVTREALRVLHQKLNFVGSVNRQYDDQYAKTGAKIGDTLKIRLPNQYVVRRGAALSSQDSTESSVSLQIASQYGVDLNFTSVDLTLSLDDFSQRIISPAMAVLAANIEGDVLSQVYKDVYYSVTNFGSPATFAKALAARKILIDNLVPQGDLNMCLQTQDNVDMVDALKGCSRTRPRSSRNTATGNSGEPPASTGSKIRCCRATSAAPTSRSRPIPARRRSRSIPTRYRRFRLLRSPAACRPATSSALPTFSASTRKRKPIRACSSRLS
jgi:hypothetical protein